MAKKINLSKSDLASRNLENLVRAAEKLYENEFELPRPQSSYPNRLEKEHVQPIVRYLLAPYEHGFWELRAKWNTNSELSNYIINKVGILSAIDFDSADSTFISAATARKMSPQQRAELIWITNRLNGVSALFTVAANKGNEEFSIKEAEFTRWIEKIDVEELKEKFPDAWKIFTEEIYLATNKFGIPQEKPYPIKSGLLVFLDSPRESGKIHVIAMTQGEVLAIRNFYSSLGLLIDPVIHRVFSPEEALFRPYFPLVSSVLTHLIRDDQISKVFSLSLAYYEDSDFQHCISSLGLIAEDLLHRIYTSILREPLPAGLTLGQTLERLLRRIDELRPNPKKTPRDLDYLHEKVNRINDSKGIDPIKSVIRELISAIQEDRAYYEKRVGEVARMEFKRSIFPPKISSNLNEMLKWRNAASHNSRIPLGAHEADRMLFCLVALIAWWQEHLATVDWTKTRLEVVDFLLSLARDDN